MKIFRELIFQIFQVLSKIITVTVMKIYFVFNFLFQVKSAMRSHLLGALRGLSHIHSIWLGGWVRQT